MARTPPSDEAIAARRLRLLAGVRELRGATLQKLWLPSPAAAVLQLRVPGRSALVVIDARLALAAVAEERPTSAESAPRSQATLRAALEGGQLALARLERAPGERAVAVRLAFETERGPRALIAGDGPALLLVGQTGGAERMVWAAAGAGPERRPGAAYRAVEEVAAEAEPTSTSTSNDDAELIRSALAAEEAAGVAARRRDLEKRLRAQIHRLRRTLAAVEEDAARAAAAAQDRRRAELLVPHQSRIPRGASEARVPDWAELDEHGSPGEVVLQLDPALSAAENAARWFRRGHRYEAAAPRIAARRAEVAAALARAEQLLSRASAAQGAASLRDVEDECARIVPRRAPRAQAGAPRRPYRTFRSAAGARILVGRTAKDNDALTVHVARGNDLWLHARGVQGSHVVVPDPGEAPDSRTLADAALLAAHFSRARGSEGTEVSWTRRKHVRKPKGAAPGLVIATQERTVRVRLDESRLAALLSTEE